MIKTSPKGPRDHGRSEVMYSDEEMDYKNGSSDSDNEVTMDMPKSSNQRRGSRENDDNQRRGSRENDRRDTRNDEELMANPLKRNNKSFRVNSKPETITPDSSASKSYIGSQECTSIADGFPSVLTAYKSGTDHEFIQCVIIRDRTGFQAKVFPIYELRLQESNKVLIIAKKMNMNRTSNYHLFDMTRGQVGKTLTKKSGNYIGKLRAKNVQRTDYLLLNHAAERQEVAGFMFDRADSLAETREGIRPRKLSVILPRLNNLGKSVPNRVGDDQDSSIIEILRATSSSDRHGMHMFETKEPAFINGNFRLNFNGRVSIPSVKNFQLIAEDDAENVLCQFGKVDDDKFHLDFKTPFNAFQAFALALSQFNL